MSHWSSKALSQLQGSSGIGESVVGLLICSKSGEMSTRCWASANWLKPCQVTPPCNSHVHTGVQERPSEPIWPPQDCTALQCRASLSHSLGLFPSTYVSLSQIFGFFFFLQLRGCFLHLMAVLGGFFGFFCFFCFLQLRGCFLHLMAVLRIHGGHFLVCHGEELALDLGTLEKLGNTRIFLYFYS